MKKPGSPAASRAMSGCVALFREGNESCVHRFQSPGGGPFCVARCRVFFYHSLSQVSLLGRNLITVFLRVNNLGHFFSHPLRPVRRADVPRRVEQNASPHRRADADRNPRMIPHLFLRGFVRATHDDAHACTCNHAAKPIPNESRTEARADVCATRRHGRAPAPHKVVCAKSARTSSG